ncbi:MAG: lipopolysaccharide biosynthesis protein [Candidatus Omnitrophica bacterium]|nr:lipopolysaccharide biosynthesis protein [Candidatus Omnitrophota bacterium]
MTLKSKAVKGIGWVSLSSGTVQAVKFIAKILLTRILFPEDFGLVAIGLFVIGCFSLLQGLGINGSLIRRAGNDDIKQAADTAFILVLITGVVLWFVSFILAYPAAEFFRNRSAAGVIRVLSFSFLISSFEIVPAALLTREIEFRKRFIPEVLSAGVYAGVALVCARGGYGYWSLVWGYMASVTVNTLVMWLVSGYKPSFAFHKRIAAELLGYGKYIAASVIVAFLMFQCDNAVVGRMLGMQALGHYSMAYAIANMPALSIGLVISGSLYPVFSKLQHDPDKLKRALLLSLKMLTVVLTPLTVGIIIMSGEFVSVFLSDQWEPMVFCLKLLSIFGLFRAMQSMISFLLHAVGEARMDVVNSVIQLVIMAVLIIPLTVAFSIEGTSLAVTVMLILGFTRLLYLTKRRLSLETGALARVFFTPAAGAAVMAVSLYALRHILPFAREPSTAGFIFICGSGALIYAGVSILIDRQVITQAKELAGTLVSRGS